MLGLQGFLQKKTGHRWAATGEEDGARVICILPDKARFRWEARVTSFCLFWFPSVVHGSGFSFQESPLWRNKRLEHFLGRLVSLFLAVEGNSSLNSKAWICSMGADDTIILGKPWNLQVIGLQWQQQSFQPSPCPDENPCTLNSGPFMLMYTLPRLLENLVQGTNGLVAPLTLTEVSHQGRFSGAYFFW